MDKSINITNFIGVYDNFITEEECNRAIKLYDDQDKFNNTVNRMAKENASILEKQDTHFFASGSNVEVWWESLNTMMLNFTLAWNHYLKNTGAHSAYDNKPFNYTTLKFKKLYLLRVIMYGILNTVEDLKMKLELLLFQYI